MSTCPENGLHHLYLDDEIPAEYLEKYSAHTINCAACQKKITDITVMRNALKLDSECLGLSSDEIDESYQRLLARMRFRTVSSTLRKRETSRFVGQTLPWVAAVIIIFSGGYFFMHGNIGNNAQGFMTTAQISDIQNPNSLVKGDFTAIAFADESQTNFTSEILGSMTQFEDLPYIPDIDVFKPSFFYTLASARRRPINRQMWSNGVMYVSHSANVSGE
jgi:hypothetical protein